MRRPPWATPVKPKAEEDSISDSVRKTVKARAAGLCELTGEPCPNGHLHHRMLESRGGYSLPSNLVYVASLNHRRIHSWPAWAHEEGWQVHSWENPRDIPLLYRGERWVRLDDFGNLVPCAAPEGATS